MKNPKSKVKVQVSMGEGAVARAPQVVSSTGLGSCVAVALYDPQRRIGGLAHIMLPDSVSLNGHHGPYRCVNTAIATLLKKLRARGVTNRDIVAKIVGGARMFASYDGSETGIGDQNIVSVKHLLTREGIRLIGEDTGGHRGRSVEFHLDSGKLTVMVIGEEDKEI